jgi:iron(III) transport system ATP-binding protein
MLEVRKLTKQFTVRGAASVNAVKDVSFTVHAGEFFTLLGPSGCGKTTTLRCVAGLDRPQSGKISLRDKTVFDSDNRICVAPNKRNVGMVFQSYAIWPHLNVFNNVAFPLRASGRETKTIASKVSWALDLVGLSGFADRPATQLSGGQQQRVALARALVKEPDLLLLDEPLSNLDAKLRERMRSELKRLQRELGITTIYVTHDQVESIQMSDRIAVMNGGHILQIGNPADVYERPASRFVADFMGATNLIEGVLRKSVNGPAVGFVDTAVGLLQCTFSCALSEGTRVLVSLRPENIKFVPEKASTDPNVIRGRIKERSAWQGVADYSIEVGGFELRVRAAANGSSLSDTDAVQLELMPDKCVVVSTDKGERFHESAAAL